MPLLPEMTREQRAAALAKAAEARVTRAAAKEKLKAGTLTLDEVLKTDDPVLRKTKVSVILQALPGIGKVRAAAIMADAGIAEGRRVGGLGVIQRAALIERLAA